MLVLRTGAAPQPLLKPWLKPSWVARIVQVWTRRRDSSTPPGETSPQQRRRDERVLALLGYGMYTLYMGVPIANLLVGVFTAVALAMALRELGGTRADWRAWGVVVGLLAVGVLIPTLVPLFGGTTAHGWGWAWKAVPAVLGLIAARYTMRHLPAVGRWALRATPAR